MNTTVVILAAGLGTRMRSKRAKVLHGAGGVSLVEHVVQAARAVAAPERIVVVTGHQADQVEELLKPTGVVFARQVEQKGTGHAVMCAKAKAKGPGLLMVLYGDTPLLSGTTLRELREAQAKSDAAATLITTTLDDPAGYGRVLINENGHVESIVEHRAATPEQLKVRLINSGIYCFRADLLWKYIGELKPDNPAHELYLTDMAAILNRHKHHVQQLHIEDSSELLGINTRVELADADRILRVRKAKEVMLSGVTIERPETVAIDAQVRVGPDTIIEPFARLLGNTVVGENCRIGQGAILSSAALADDVTIAPYTVVSDSRIDPGAEVGPFARIRMQAEIGPFAKVGNFVELKNTRLGAESKSQHLAYLGDSEIGQRVNIGAGTITCNYDGEKKHATKIGEGAFIGSNSTLVAPLEIGGGAYVGAGSVITDNVPKGALALGRERQIVKAGWISKRKKKTK
ncbi:MAG: bifunctional UDP-N-acetylglucosamine diphosphorylase/glucosamine-1-phosphate N-acetyltransferase GlmU [Bryobacteraceae bacterium]